MRMFRAIEDRINNMMQRNCGFSSKCCQFMSRCHYKMGFNVQEVFGDTPVNDKQEEQVTFGMTSDHDAGLTSMDGQKEERNII